MTVAPHTGQIVESPSTGPATFVWRSEEDTAAWAQRLAAQPALAHAFVTLHGDLGAGKTTLVRHLLRALGVQGRIKSPTYAVVEPHETAGLAIWHFDFYRFDDPREWEDSGLRDLLADTGLKLVEWPEKAGSLLPPPDWDIQLQPVDDSARQARIEAHSARGMHLLQSLELQT